MPTTKVLVLGGTGAAGLCLLRELLYRNHAVVAYVRNPSKIPSDLSSNANLSIVQGEMDSYTFFSSAIRGCSAVISLLGPAITNASIPHTMYPDMYRNIIIPAMREHSVKRILLMGTLIIQRPEDSWILMTTPVVAGMKLFARGPYYNVINIGKLFQDEVKDLDWTIFRVTAIPGEPDEESWRKGREGKLYVGPIGGKGWTRNTNRSLLAKWLVDTVEGGSKEWVRKMPAVTQLAGS